MAKRYTTKQVGFHWVLLDNATGRETMMDSRGQAQRLARDLNGRPTYQQRLADETADLADEVVGAVDAFLDANPDCAF